MYAPTEQLAHDQMIKYQQAIDAETKKMVTRFEWWLLCKFRNGNIGTWLTGLTIGQYENYTEIYQRGIPKVRIYKTGHAVKLKPVDDD